MQSKNLKVLLVVSLLLFVSMAIVPQFIVAQSDAVSPRTSIVLADIGSNPAKKIKRFQPLADYLAANLTDYGIDVGEVKIAPDMDTLIGWIEAGEVDMYFDSPFPVMFIAGETGAQPILRRWKDGVEEYHSVIFALADKGLESVEDLQGQLVAFDSPQSTSGFMLPLAHLLENELATVEVDKNNISPNVADNEIGYVFTEDDEITIQWVIAGRMAAGVVDSQTYITEIPEETREHLVILAETVAVPRQIALVSPDMDPELVETITALLLELTETDEGLAVLDDFDTSQFDEFPQGAEATLEELRAMFDLVTQTNEE